MGYFIFWESRDKPPKLKQGGLRAAFASHRATASTCHILRFWLNTFHWHPTKGYRGAQQSPVVHIDQLPQNQRAHSCRKKIKEGMEVGRTHLFPSSTMRIRVYVFLCSFSYALQNRLISESYRLHWELQAGSWWHLRSLVLLPWQASCLPGRGHQPPAQATEGKILVSALHCQPQHRDTSLGSTVNVVLDACPKGTCFDSKLAPVPSGCHLWRLPCTGSRH